MSQELIRELYNIGEVKKVLQEADRVLIQPRFGTFEGWLFITKKEAKYLLLHYEDSDNPYELKFPINDILADLWEDNETGEKFLYLGGS